MRQRLTLALLLCLLPVLGAAAEDDCGRCCKLQLRKDRKFRSLKAAEAVCADTGDSESCELAQQLGNEYQELCEQYEAQCMPPLRAE